MERKKYLCISCRIDITNSAGAVHLVCPSCGKAPISRCPSCRKIGTKYICPQCHFEGP